MQTGWGARCYTIVTDSIAALMPLLVISAMPLPFHACVAGLTKSLQPRFRSFSNPRRPPRCCSPSPSCHNPVIASTSASQHPH